MSTVRGFCCLNYFLKFYSEFLCDCILSICTAHTAESNGGDQDNGSGPDNSSLLKLAALDTVCTMSVCCCIKWPVRFIREYFWLSFPQAFGFVPCLICIAVLSTIYAISAIVICAKSCTDWTGYATIWAICAGILSTIMCISVSIVVSVAPKVVRCIGTDTLVHCVSDVEDEVLCKSYWEIIKWMIWLPESRFP